MTISLMYKFNKSIRETVWVKTKNSIDLHGKVKVRIYGFLHFSSKLLTLIQCATVMFTVCDRKS